MYAITVVRRINFQILGMKGLNQCSGVEGTLQTDRLVIWWFERLKTLSIPEHSLSGK